MSTQREQILEAAGLRVRFLFRDDRYVHEIWRHSGSQWNCVLTSIDGSPHDAWPASPPLQSLHLEDRPGAGPTALLVGMAGHSHWSVSVELDPTAGAAHFDAACRARGFGPLGSRYRIVEPIDSAGLAISVSPETGAARLEEGQGELQIMADWQASPAAQTVRWRYTIGPPGAASTP